MTLWGAGQGKIRKQSLPLAKALESVNLRPKEGRSAAISSVSSDLRLILDATYVLSQFLPAKKQKGCKARETVLLA